MHASAIARDRCLTAHAECSPTPGATEPTATFHGTVRPLLHLAVAGVPYGVFDAPTGQLWWDDHAHELLSAGEQRALALYLRSIVQGRSALHAFVLGGRLEPASTPRLRLSISAHPDRPSRTVVVLSPRPAVALSPALERLSTRERAVADLIAKGDSTKCIAATLRISEHTVRRHTEHLFAKLGVRSRAAVAALVAASTA